MNAHRVGAVLTALAVLIGAPAATADLVTGLVANWRLDETSGTFADQSGNGHTGTGVGAPHGSGANGLLVGAADLDGDDDYINCGDMAAFEITDSFSAALWLDLDAPPTDFDFYLGRQTSGTVKQGWRISNGSSGKREEVRVIMTDAEGDLMYEDSGAVLDGAAGWQHLAFTYNGNPAQQGTGANQTIPGLAVYVNGSEIEGLGTSALDGSSDISPGGVDFSLGTRAADGAGEVAGDMDEVGVWGRVLTPDEIAALYNNGAGRLIVPGPASLAVLALGGLALLRRRRSS